MQPIRRRRATFDDPTGARPGYRVGMAWEIWFGIAVLVVAAIALGVALGIRYQQSRARRRSAASGSADSRAEVEAREVVAFVANPSKPDVAGLEETVRRAFAEAALPDPLWLETTVEDPGGGQTREAVARGADVVVAVGGDGTVRAVAEGLVGTGRTMGLIALGTGNLLARNLDLPVADANSALRVVIAGSDRAIDVGWVRVTEYARISDEEAGVDAEAGSATEAGATNEGTATEDGGAETQGTKKTPGTLLGAPDEKHIFLVIAGLGFDAAMVADADDALKAKVGWVAYFLAGIRHLHGRRMHARITLDDDDPVDARLRSLMIGNCGKLPGGITLLPDAVIDDGILDIAAVDTRGGLVGWAQLFGEVVMQGFGVRNDLPAKIGRIDHTRAERVRVRVEEGEQAQVDGDVLGLAVEIESWVEAGALVVRTA